MCLFKKFIAKRIFQKTMGVLLWHQQWQNQMYLYACAMWTPDIRRTSSAKYLKRKNKGGKTET